jgi:hypothetical protein
MAGNAFFIARDRQIPPPKSYDIIGLEEITKGAVMS